MLNQAEFDRRVQENTETYKKQCKKSGFDVTKYHLAHIEKGKTAIPILLKHIHDIYGAVMTGCLPTLTGKGCDAIKMVDGIESPLELKTSYVLNDNLWSDNGILYASGTKRKKKVDQAFKADYHIYGNSDSKIIETILICMDSITGQLICVHALTANDMFDKLSMHNKKSCSRTSISLSYFMKHGTNVDTVVEQIGFKNWHDNMIKVVPKGPYGN